MNERERFRIVSANAGVKAALMPLEVVLRRYDAATDLLKSARLRPEHRTVLLHVRTLLARDLGARLFDPRTARRCEQELRWLDRAWPEVSEMCADTWVARILRRLKALLPALPVAPAT